MEVILTKAYAMFQFLSIKRTLHIYNNKQGGEPMSQSRDKNIETDYNLVKFHSRKRHFRAVNCVFVYFMLCLMRKWQPDMAKLTSTLLSLKTR